MKKVFMIHGFNGEPNGGWRPWLMGKLGRKGIWAYALDMLTPDKPKLNEWVEAINKAVGIPTEETILIGHSLDVPTILHYLESLSEKSIVGGVILVSGPIHILEKDKYSIIDHFMDKAFDFEHMKKVCRKFSVIHGDDDPNVPFEHARELSDKLSCELVSVSGGKHLSGSGGFYEVPQILDSLEKMIF